MPPLLQTVQDELERLFESISGGAGKEAVTAMLNAHDNFLGVSCFLPTLLLSALQVLTAPSWLHMEIYACLLV